MTVDKNQAIISYLLNCPAVKTHSMFFNFAEEKDSSNQVVTRSDDTVLNTQFIDGSVQKQFSFVLLVYKTATYNPIVKQEGFVNENVSDISDVQELIDWIHEQNDEKVFPNFGETCIIDSIETTSDRPKLNGVNNQVQPPLAQYQITINIKYLDISKTLWNNN